MRRLLAISTDVVAGHAETVLCLSQREVPLLALEVALLLEGMAGELTVRGPQGARVLLALQATTSQARAAVSHPAAQAVRFDLPRNQAEFLQAVLLRSYRDGLAEVDHVHLEADAAGQAHDLTVMFELAREPMTAQQAMKLLDD